MSLSSPSRASAAPRGLSAPFLLSAVLLAACAGNQPRPAPAPQAVTPPERGAPAAAPREPAPALETLRPGLRHAEDSLILDLLIGYQQRLDNRSDLEAERRARAAFYQLDYMIRHGGVKDHGDEARVIAPPEGEKLTLRETVDQLSEDLLRATPGVAWRPETERARDIQRRRADLSTLVEDADWILTLAAELEGSQSSEQKARLRRLHEAYAARAPHAEVAAQVTALLADTRNERLRREIKKLANRSWERERRAKTDPPLPPKTPAPKRPAPPAPPAIPVLPSEPPATPAAAFDTAPVPAPPAGSAAAEKADTLITPARYCADRRAEAAQAFASARGAANAAARQGFLRQSLELLDACLTRYPDAPEAEKARQNRARVEQELKP